MKNFYFLPVFILLIANSVFAQFNGNKVIRGERPPINLSKISSDAFEPGIIKIKLTPEAGDRLKQFPQGYDAKGNIIFNMEAIDALNAKYQVKKSMPVFEIALSNTDFTEKHEAWGFHLWYILYVDSKTDLKKMITDYSKLAEIEFAEPEYKKRLLDGQNLKNAQDFKWTPNDPRYNEQWHYHNTGQTGGTVDKDIDLPEAWDIEKGHVDVIVSVEDGGIETTHADLNNNIWSGVGYNFVNGNTTIVPHNHGTHVAGTIAAENNNNTGVCGIAGGNGTTKGISLMSCQVFTNSSSGGFEDAPIWAADNGACISQNSWSYTQVGAYDQVVLDAIDYFNANGGGDQLNGGITIFAAGNDDTEGLWYPACYSGSFAVAATTHNDTKAWYSNYGTWVDISAPGGETDVSEEGVLSTVTGGSYDFYQGTSMACPHTSGVAALIVSLAYRNGLVLSNTDVADILTSTVDNHYGVNGSYIGKLGAGRLNAYQALLETQNYLSGVLNPSTFTAVPVSISQIDLNWTKNNDNNNVIMAWSSDGVFGTPVNGTTYTSGNAIPGGGTVLYNGDLTMYNHTGLNSGTTYYYKIWSYNASNEYSSGRTAQAKTLMESIFYDGFETNLGWVLNGEWERAAPQGLGGEHGEPDPGSAYNGTNILGYDLSGTGTYPGDYEANLTNKQYTAVSPTIDCSGYEGIELQFQRLLGVESSQYDHAYIDISINGGTNWTQIWANESSTISESDWSLQTIDISSYADDQSNVKIRFAMGASDGSWQYCGWNIDDFYIFGTPINNTPVASISTTPGCNTGSVTVSSNMSGTQTFYLCDNSGNVLNEWTGSATNHVFTGIVNGTYRGRVEKDAVLSELSSPATLTNLTNPTKPDEVNASDTDICPGGNTLLSYSGGSGTTFNWYSQSCGVGFVGTGNNFSVSPSETTTYYGRWTNSCGNSDCESVSVTVGITTLIVDQPDDINANEGDNVTFTVAAEGSNLNYQWRFNGSDISDATNAVYTINNVQLSDAGNYDVEVTGNCGIEMSDAAVLSVSTGIDNLRSLGIQIFPNPTEGNLNIVFREVGKNTICKISDITGKVLIEEKLIEKENLLNLNRLTKGVYFIELLYQDTRNLSKLVIE